MGAWPSPSFQATLVGPVCAFSQGRAHPRVPHEFLSFPWLWAHLPVMLHPVSAAPGRDGGGRLGSCDQGPEHASLSPSEAGGHGRVWTGWGGPRRSPALGSEYLCPSAASVCMCTYVFGQPPGVPHDRADRLLDLYASGERRAYGPPFLRAGGFFTN